MNLPSERRPMSASWGRKKGYVGYGRSRMGGGQAPLPRTGGAPMRTGVEQTTNGRALSTVR
ncbi:hypothetical protein AZA_53399 [Nitrospirillum viridazoti Y2]|nr:hypothetical protein AZA_53399 [Nitrospirillum amazonense Y2]